MKVSIKTIRSQAHKEKYDIHLVLTNGITLAYVGRIASLALAQVIADEIWSHLELDSDSGDEMITDLW
jgi:hypothetical protein